MKRKIVFRGHVLFEAVRPLYIESALNYLKFSNPFYSSILNQMDNISKKLLLLNDDDAIVDLDEFPLVLEDNIENLEDEVKILLIKNALIVMKCVLYRLFII